MTCAKIGRDGKTVYFLRDFQGWERHQLYAIRNGHAEEEQLSNFEDIRLFDFALSPNNREIALTGSTAKFNYVWIFNLETRIHEPVYECPGWGFSTNYSSQGDMLVFSANTTGIPRSSELVIINITKTTLGHLPLNRAVKTQAWKWSPSKKKILFRTNAAGPYDLAIYDVDSDTTTYLGLSSYGVDFTDFSWLTDEGVWFVARFNGRSRLYVVKNGVREIDVGGTITGIEVNESGDVAVFSLSSLSTPPAVYSVNLATNEMHLLFQPRYAAELPLGKAEFITYKSFDGLTIPAFLVLHNGRWALSTFA